MSTRSLMEAVPISAGPSSGPTSPSRPRPWTRRSFSPIGRTSRRARESGIGASRSKKLLSTRGCGCLAVMGRFRLPSSCTAPPHGGSLRPWLRLSRRASRKPRHHHGFCRRELHQRHVVGRFRREGNAVARVALARASPPLARMERDARPSLRRPHRCRADSAPGPLSRRRSRGHCPCVQQTPVLSRRCDRRLRLRVQHPVARGHRANRSALPAPHEARERQLSRASRLL